MEKGKKLSAVIHSSHNWLKVSRKQRKCQKANLKPQDGDPRTIITPIKDIDSMKY